MLGITESSLHHLTGRWLPHLLSVLVITCLSLLALLCVVNSFAGHLTPDVSTYLLHTRTFIQELDRFTLSHDSKGMMLIFILVLPVLVFGPTMVAAALAQFCAHAIAFAACYLIIRRYAAGTPALIVALLGLCTIHSYRIWGGNARPEDFAVAFVMVALWAALRGNRRLLALAGAMTACCFFLKVSSVITPAMITFIAILYNAVQRARTAGDRKFPRAFTSIVEDSAWALLGFAAVTVLVIGWILLFDDIQGWYRQSIQWPLEYRTYAIPFWDRAKTTFDLLEKTTLVPLFLAGCIGLIIAWTRGYRKEAVLVAVAIVAELYRITTEIGRWYYLMTVMIPLLMMAASYLCTVENRKTRSALIWLAPLVFLLPFISDLPRTELKAFELQSIKRCPSPSKFFADTFRPIFKDGETILVASIDVQVFLLTNAPRPAPVLPTHFSYVSGEEQEETRRYYRQAPPEWVIRRSSSSECPLPNITGGVDYAYHVQCPATDSSQLPQLPELQEETGPALFPTLPESTTYRLEIESGYFQAWRLVETLPPEPEMSQ